MVKFPVTDVMDGESWKKNPPFMVKLPVTVKMIVGDPDKYMCKLPPLMATLAIDWLVVKVTVCLMSTSSPAPGTTAEAGPPIDVDHVLVTFQFPVTLE